MRFQKKTFKKKLEAEYKELSAKSIWKQDAQKHVMGTKI